jgi:hypothetical protein
MEALTRCTYFWCASSSEDCRLRETRVYFGESEHLAVRIRRNTQPAFQRTNDPSHA